MKDTTATVEDRTRSVFPNNPGPLLSTHTDENATAEFGPPRRNLTPGSRPPEGWELKDRSVVVQRTRTCQLFRRHRPFPTGDGRFGMNGMAVTR